MNRMNPMNRHSVHEITIPRSRIDLAPLDADLQLVPARFGAGGECHDVLVAQLVENGLGERAQLGCGGAVTGETTGPARQLGDAECLRVPRIRVRRRSRQPADADYVDWQVQTS